MTLRVSKRAERAERTAAANPRLPRARPLGPVTLPEHATDLALSPDGGSLLVLGHSGALWRVMLRSQTWIERARRIAGRSLTSEEERRYGVDTWRAGGEAPA